MVAVSAGLTRIRLAKGTPKTSEADTVIASNTSVGEAAEATSMAAVRSACCSAAMPCSSRRASAFEIAVATSSVKAASRASVSAGNGPPSVAAMLMLPKTLPPTTIGAPTAAFTPASRASASRPTAFVKSWSRAGPPVSWIVRVRLGPTRGQGLPAGNAGTPNELRTTIASRSKRQTVVNSTSNTCATSRATAEKTGSGGWFEATSIATRRSAACSSARRSTAMRDSAFAIAVATSSVKSLSRASVSAGSGSRRGQRSTIAPPRCPSTTIGLATAGGRDPPQGGLLVSELADALFRALEHLHGRGLGPVGGSADEVRLALTQRLRHGDRPVVENDLATALRHLERRRVRRLVAIEKVAVTVHEQVRASRHEIAVATSQPGVLVAPVRQEALLHRRSRDGHQLQTPRVRDLPGAREVDQSDDSAGYRIVHRGARADPLVVALVEVLEGEYLKGVICGERCPDAVRAVDRFAQPCALEEIHLASPLLQPLGTIDVQEEPGCIGHDDQALRLLGHDPKLRRDHVLKRAKRVFEPTLPHLRLVRLDRDRQVGRIEACGKRTLPRLDDRRSQSGRGFRWKFEAEPALGE